MRRIIFTLAAFIFSFGVIAAQDLGTATETYNKGANALAAGDKTSALKYFQEALTMGTAIGDEASELVENCKNAIPKVVLSIGKELCNDKQFDKAIEEIEKARNLAKEYGVKEVSDECAELLPQIEIQRDVVKANDLFSEKKINEAKELYCKILEKDTTNSTASIRIIQCLVSLNDIKSAKSYFKVAEKNGQGENAAKVIGGAILKNAAANLKSNKYQEAINEALESDNYCKNPQAFLIAGQAATKMNKNKEAIEFFEKYLGLAPTAKNAGQIALTLGVLYQGQNNKEKAIEFYKKAKALGIETQQYIDALSK